MKKFLAAMATAAILTVSGTVSAASFPDIPAGHWAAAKVNAMADAGIVEGFSDGTYRGDRSVTRSEMAKMAANLLLKVSPGSTAEAKKIIEGASSANGVDKDANRFEVALTLAKVYEAAHKGSLPTVSSNEFSDVPQGHWAAPSVNLMAKLEVMSGYGDGTFRGNNNMTRYEAALALDKLYEILSK